MNGNQTILVTGGAGFIGANFIHYWLENYPQNKVINLDALTYAGNKASLADIESNSNYTFVEGNIGDGNLLDRIMADVDIVVHFAAETHVDRSILNPAVFLQTNVIGTQFLLEAALKHSIKRFHHISTDEVFGSLDLGSQEQFSESTPYDPKSPYSASKAASDHLVRAYGETYGLPFTISNCSNNYGPYQFPEKLVALAITNLIENKPVPVYGDGLNVRDWLFVKDHCRAIDQILNTSQLGETYMIGGLKNDISNLDLVKLIIQIMGASENSIEYVKDRAGHDRRYSVDWSKINRDTGWNPKVTLEEGIDLAIKWYQSNRGWWEPLKIQSKDFFERNYQSKNF